ncbi:MAG: DivIVA domain-containing protein [Bacteroidota bacterium]
MLDPLQIRKKEFTSAFRGISEDEVRNFLHEVSRQWEELLSDNRRAEARVQELEGKLAHYVRIEEALQEAVHSARENARRTQETAEQRAKLITEEAEMRAQQLVQDAEHERYLAKQDLSKLNNRISEVTARLRAFHTSELEILAAFTGEEPTGYFPRVAQGTRRALPAAGAPLVGDAPVHPESPTEEARTAEPRPAEPRATETRPVEARPAEARPAETRPSEPAPADTSRSAMDFRALFTPPSRPAVTDTVQRDTELEKATIRRIIEDID